MTDQRKLDPTVPADAAIIIDQFLGAMRMDGLTGQQVSVLLAAVGTIKKALPEDPPA